MFTRHCLQGYKHSVEGILRKTLVHGERMLLTEFLMKKGSHLPEHSHPQDQTGYLVSGSIRLRIGEDSLELKPGDSWYVPGNITHEADVIDEAVAIEVFSPLREDYLP